MKKSLAPIALVAAMAGGAGALAFAPGLAGAQADDPAADIQDEGAATASGPLRAALDGLVEDGTLTQAQADTVLERLRDALPAKGFRGGPHFGIKAGGEEVAEYLGLSTEEIRDALRDGTSLAELAEQEGKSVDGLVDVIVAAETEAIDAAVADGKLSEERAAEIKDGLEERVADRVDNARPAGPRFRHRFGWPGAGAEVEADDSAA
ncbi:MAG: hypothetical protein AB7H43_13000 [Acidimicrobiia bacterium]